jgi:succinate dehydrogenase / fumarate reductase flavoprotein subunit
LIARTGDENAYRLHEELGRTMTENVTVVRYNDRIRETLAKIDELSDRYQRAPLADKGQWTNQNLSFTRALGDMLILAKVIAEGALARDECRGAHYKPDFEIAGLDPAAGDLTGQARKWCEKFKQRNDKWLKTTIAEHSADGPRMSYEEVDTTLINPRPRTYGLKGAEEIERIWKTEFSGSAGLPAASKPKQLSGAIA